MTVPTRTRAAATRTLDELIVNINTACERFDQGRYAEAKLLAGHIRALFHHTDKSAAVIERLGLREVLTWIDTAGVPNPKVDCPTAGLTLMRIRSRHHGEETYVPKLSMYPPVPIRSRSGEQIYSGSRIPFEHWWTNPVITDADGAHYSRQQLVLALCDQDDAEAEAARSALRRSASLGWVVSEPVDAESKPLCSSPVIASIRQIGYEVLQSISEQSGFL
ncbi:hypothetical protein C6A85_000000104570, partial [Mycobacterium sp. ITM-2017-0098]